MIGKIISHYKILEKLGEGGMGVVYLAQDIKLERKAALKFLPSFLSSEKEAIERFQREAKAAAALNHPNIVTVYETGEFEGHIYIVLEYLAGSNLRQAITESTLSENEIIDVAIQICEGLAKAHKAGIVHRDIKPENIFIDEDGFVKILDFGIVKLKGTKKLTKETGMMGTVQYMSPEQVLGGEVDHRADIWSLGVVFYEMLTGQVPFKGEYDQAVMYEIVHEKPQPLHFSFPELPSNFQIVLDRTLKTNPDDRYPSAHEMIKDLQALSDTGPTESPTPITAVESEKISYLPDYQNDVFVSYAYVDNKSLTQGKIGWVDNFHQALEIRLEQLLGADTKIWRDDNLKNNATNKTDPSAPLPSTAVLISMVSPQYIKSEKCLQEVKDFYKTAEQGEGVWLNNRARIFKAVKTYVPRESQPEILQSIPDYEFYRFDPVSGRPQEFWPELGAEANRNFWIKLEDIAYDIYQLIEMIKKGNFDTVPTGSVPERSFIYLAEPSKDLIDHRDTLKRQLQQRGYSTLPDRPLFVDIHDLKNQIQDDLKRCILSVHLLGENYGTVPEGETTSTGEIQHELAIEHSKTGELSRLIWMPPGLQTQDERQHKFIESLRRDTSAQIGTDLLQTSLGEFKTFLIDKLIEKPRESDVIESEDKIKRIYLQCDQKDIDATAPMEEYLYDLGFEIKLPAFEGDESEVFEVHKENLLRCDATIIYYGNATDSWLNTKLADLQKIAGYGRPHPLEAKAVYIASPETKLKQRFRTREALTIKDFADFSPDSLAPFIETIQKEKGEKS